jgi:hypothetical protein
MTERVPHHQGLLARPDQPLVGVITHEDGEEMVRYFTENGQPSARASDRIAHALALAGAWGETDWEQTADELDRIRHQSEPTPPIDLET